MVIPGCNYTNAPLNGPKGLFTADNVNTRWRHRRGENFWELGGVLQPAAGGTAAGRRSRVGGQDLDLE